MDETYIGGHEPGLAGGRAKGKKTFTGIAVEIHEPKGFGRCRMGPLATGNTPSRYASMSRITPIRSGSMSSTRAWVTWAENCFSGSKMVTLARKFVIIWGSSAGTGGNMRKNPSMSWTG